MTNLSWPVVVIDQAGDMHKGTLSTESKKRIRELLLKMIGDDTLETYHLNTYKAELRQKIEEL